MRFLSRYWLVVLIFGFAGSWGGGQSVYTALKNREPTEVPCLDASKARPDAEWLKLTDCVVYASTAAYEGQDDSPRRLYVPVRHPDASAEDPAAFVLVTEDQRWLDFARDLIAAPDDPTAEQIADMLQKHPFAFEERSTITGLVQFGIELKDEKRRKVNELIPNLAEDFMLIEDGAQPRPGLGAGMLAFGLACLVLGGLGALRRFRGA